MEAFRKEGVRERPLEKGEERDGSLEKRVGARWEFGKRRGEKAS
jgi:hypothetical protein